MITGFTWIAIMILWTGIYEKSEDTLCKIQTEQSLNIWLFVKKLSPTFIPWFERENQCCGWFGVFDHCTSQNRDAIIIESVETQAFDEIQNSLNIDTSLDDKMFEGMDLNRSDSSYSEAFNLSYGHYDDFYSSSSYVEYHLDSSNNRHGSLSICDPDFYKSEFLFYWNRNCTDDKTVGEVCFPDVCHINGCSRWGFLVEIYALDSFRLHK